MPFINHNKHVVILSDLRCKLFINETKVPLITSDNPIVQYNQFLEYYTKNISITGYASKGLQIIFPITPKLLIMLYDSQVYNVGGKKGRTARLINGREIDQLNILQLLNCNANVYGDETMSEDYIQSLYDKAKSFIKPKEFLVEKFRSIEHAITELSQKSSHRIGLSLSQVSLSTHASRFKPDNSLGYGRDFALDAIDAFRNDPRFQDQSI